MADGAGEDPQTTHGALPGERITEIGGWERIDRANHPFAAAVALIALIAAFVIGLVALGAAVDYGDRRVDVPDVLVPSVVGASEDSARATLEEVGLLMEVAESTNELVGAGVVFEQVPLDGARLEIGSSVTARVSTGPAGAVVPQVVGQQAAEAQALLVASGLSGEVANVYDEDVRPGEVLGTEPDAGQRAPGNGVVTLEVSQGPEPRVVPEVQGREDLDVLAELGRLRLRPGSIDFESGTGLPDGQVISIAPAPGTSVPRGSTVDLVVAGTRALVAMPSVLGLLQATAQEALADSAVEPVFRVVALAPGDSRSGRVIRQGVEAGADVPAGTVVEILVGRAPPPPTTTTTTTTAVGPTSTTTPD